MPPSSFGGSLLVSLTVTASRKYYRNLNFVFFYIIHKYENYYCHKNSLKLMPSVGGFFSSSRSQGGGLFMEVTL